MTKTPVRALALTVAGTALVAGTTLAAAAPANAKSPRVIETEQCGTIFTKLKLSPEDGGMEVEYELDQNRNGRRWSLRLERNGSTVATTTKTTTAPSGSLRWRVVTGDPAGTDTFTVTATRGATTCDLSAAM